MKGIVVVTLAGSMAACVFVSRRVDVEPIGLRAPVTVTSPVKAHLHDGSIVVYPEGVRVTGDALVGEGMRHDPLLATAARVDRVPLADVLGMESYRTRVNRTESIIVSTMATAGAVVGTAALAVAVFGSCPTVYSAEGAVEEAELFSSSIAPLFEARDVDRLHAQATPEGIVSLEVRNEAMETHYINHLQLLEVQHAADQFALPDQHGAPVVVGRLREPAAVRSREGRELRELLARSDDRFYSTDRKRLRKASAGDMSDWIDVTVPVEAGAASAAVVFRMRNSLLSTVLLYDVMLAPAGAAALDWLGEGLMKISTAVELGRWHYERTGLRVSVWQDGSFTEVARIADSGPISWRDVAAVIPVPSGETQLRLRLSYLADHWRIDRVAVSFAVTYPAPRIVGLSEVIGHGGTPEDEALSSLKGPDERYLQTTPGQKLVARFDAGPEPAHRSRTFLLSSQGYYTEWIRGSWIATATAHEPFVASDESILVAMRKWAVTRESFETRFRTARVPVQ